MSRDVSYPIPERRTVKRRVSKSGKTSLYEDVVIQRAHPHCVAKAIKNAARRVQAGRWTGGPSL